MAGFPLPENLFVSKFLGQWNCWEPEQGFDGSSPSKKKGVGLYTSPLLSTCWIPHITKQKSLGAA